MFVLAHAGIAVGVGWLAQSVLLRKDRLSAVRPAGARLNTTGRSAADFLRKLDYRLLLVGAVLPDIIDKPLSLLIAGNMFIYGRFFSHTVLFFFLVAVHG